MDTIYTVIIANILLLGAQQVFRQFIQAQHVNIDDDKRDMGEKVIDAGTISLINLGDKIDKKLGWGGP